MGQGASQQLTLCLCKNRALQDEDDEEREYDYKTRQFVRKKTKKIKSQADVDVYQNKEEMGKESRQTQIVIETVFVSIYNIIYF